VTLSDQLNLVHSLDDVFLVLFELVSDGRMSWWTPASQLVAVSLDSAMVKFDMDNCTAGQTLNEHNSDTPTCRTSIYVLLLQTAIFISLGTHTT